MFLLDFASPFVYLSSLSFEILHFDTYNDDANMGTIIYVILFKFKEPWK